MDTINSQLKTNPSVSKGKNESALMSWIVVCSIALFFFLWGLFIYFTVGAGRAPFWRYGIVPDMPGQSVYSVQKAEERAGTALSKGGTIRKQHIMGRQEESGKPPGKKGL